MYGLQKGMLTSVILALALIMRWEMKFQVINKKARLTASYVYS